MLLERPTPSRPNSLPAPGPRPAPDPASLRVAVVGPSRFSIAEPFAGGLEAHTAGLVRSLVELGHDVSVAAGPEQSHHGLPVPVRPIVSHEYDHLFTQRRDIAPPLEFLAHETERYIALMIDLVERSSIDVVHNNSLHPAVVDADRGRVPTVHVLHCPPTPELLAAHRRLAARSPGRRVIAVSQSVASTWHGIATETILNGVDTRVWRPSGSDRHGAVWAGRIVPEKAPHLAIRACRLAHVPLKLAGPVGDEAYFRCHVERELRDDVEWLGPLDNSALAELYGASEVGVVSPVWDEPFGLVAAEMLASGTPVAAFARGGLDEFLDRRVATIATSGDAVSLADAVLRARRLDGRAARAHALDALSSERMVASYVEVYRRHIVSADGSGQLGSVVTDPAMS